jgi:hypothetical protein
MSEKEFTKLHPDHVFTDNLYLAALAHFSGSRIFRVEASAFGKSVFHLLCPSEDWALLQAELRAEDSTLVNISRFIEAISVCHGPIRRAKKAGGVFTEAI